MSSDDQRGPMSSAGLVRYFESEDSRAIRINPKTIIALSLAIAVLVQILNFI